MKPQQKQVDITAVSDLELGRMLTEWMIQSSTAQNNVAVLRDEMAKREQVKNTEAKALVNKAKSKKK